MKTATGNYLNIYSEVGYRDETDLPFWADIFICFAESSDIDLTEADERARKVLKKYKEAPCDLTDALKQEFEDDAVFVHINV